MMNATDPQQPTTNIDEAWQSATDPTSGRRYWFNLKLDPPVTSWIQPIDAAQEASSPTPSCGVSKRLADRRRLISDRLTELCVLQDLLETHGANRRENVGMNEEEGGIDSSKRGLLSALQR
jgi:hypothetical protein